jgi:hypothetical protein
MTNWNAVEYKVSILRCVRTRWQVSMCPRQVSRRTHQHESDTSAYDGPVGRGTSVKSDACRCMCIAHAQGVYISERLSVYHVGLSVITVEAHTLALQQHIELSRCWHMEAWHRRGIRCLPDL